MHIRLSVLVAPGHGMSLFLLEPFTGCLHDPPLQSVWINLKPIPLTCSLFILVMFDACSLFSHCSMPKRRFKVGWNWVFRKAWKKVERWDR